MNDKVYIVEIGAYSDRYIDGVYATKELAQGDVIKRARKGWSTECGGEAFPEPSRFATFAEWYKHVEGRTGCWGTFGDVMEYDLLTETAFPLVEEGSEVDAG